MRKIIGRIILFIVLSYVLFVLMGDKLAPTGIRSSERMDGRETAEYTNGMTAKDKKAQDLAVDKDNTGKLILVNKEYHLKSGYVPEDLVNVDVPFTANAENEEKKMGREAAKALVKLFEGAKQDGIELCAVSGYRSYSYQRIIYNQKLKKKGKEYVDAYVALPGQSEHQSGLAMDVGSFIPLNKSNNYDFGRTPEGEWLKVNAYVYGFILRYPKGKEDITGYEYEPWHIRYLGLSAAAKINEDDIVLEEYLH